MSVHANDTATNSEDVCLFDCAATHTILKDKFYKNDWRLWKVKILLLRETPLNIFLVFEHHWILAMHLFL